MRMLLHLTNQARIQDQRKRIAVLHPNFCARIAAQDGGIALIRNDLRIEENQARAYLYCSNSSRPRLNWSIDTKTLNFTFFKM
jgi:hypothetical protein